MKLNWIFLYRCFFEHYIHIVAPLALSISLRAYVATETYDALPFNLYSSTKKFPSDSFIVLVITLVCSAMCLGLQLYDVRQV